MQELPSKLPFAQAGVHKLALFVLGFLLFAVLGYWAFNEFSAVFPTHPSLSEDSGTLHVKYHPARRYPLKERGDFWEIWLDADSGIRLPLTCRGGPKPCELFDFLDQMDGSYATVLWHRPPGMFQTQVQVFNLRMNGKEIIHYDPQLPWNPDLWWARGNTAVMIFLLVQMFLRLRREAAS